MVPKSPTYYFSTLPTSAALVLCTNRDASAGNAGHLARAPVEPAAPKFEYDYDAFFGAVYGATMREGTQRPRNLSDIGSPTEPRL